MPKKPNRLTEAILEMADDQYRVGLMDEKTHRKIIVRLLGKAALANARSVSGKQILAIRKRANLSQGAFACYFNRSSSYIARLERGTKQPKGSALALFNVIRRKGLGAIL
jgi:putative transcriptional regulator